MTIRRIVTAGLSVAVLGGAPAGLARADSPPAPDGVYPLTPGIYVAEGGNCAAPALPAVRHYDGKGIRTASTRDCRAAVREHEGQRYKVDQTCLDASVGLGQRFVQRQTITVRDALSFTQAVGKASAIYHYCPAKQLPATLLKTFE